MDLSSSWTAYLRRQATASRITTEDAQGLARSPPSSNFDKTRSQRNLWSLDDDHPTPSRRPRAYVDDDHGNAESSDPTPILPRRAWAESSLKRDSSVSRPPPRRRPMHAVAPSVSPGDDPWDFDRPPQRGKLWSPDDTPRKAYAARPSRNQRTQRTQPAFTASSTKHDEDSTFKLIKQPETLSISQEQVVAEVKGIYAGLVMIESKCIEVCSSQSAQYNSTANRLNNEQWQALIALHRTLLHEHHDFFLAPQRQLFSSDNPFNKIPRKLNWRRPSWDPQYIQQFLHYSKRFTTLLSSNASLLDFAGGYLLRLLEQVGELILILCRRFIGRCPQQLLLYIFLFFYCFSEFVKGMRPLCTTMPWTIWPSLVVLWGVCWMFPQPVPSLSVTPEQQPPETDDSLDLSMFIYIPTPDDHDFSSVWSNFGSHEPGNEMGNASQPADTDPFLPSNPIPSACSTTQAQAISPLPHPNASGQFSVNNTPLATYLGHLESQPQPQPPRRSESTEQFSSAATTANVTRAVHRRALRCSDCGKSYARLDSLQRHRREVHGGRAGNKETLFCPHPQCPKGVTGVGFKRQDKLDHHLQKTCKVRLPVPALDHDGTHPVATPPSARETSDTSSSYRSGSSTREPGDVAGPKNEVFGDQSVISTLKRLRSVAETKLEKLQAEIASYDLIIAKLESDSSDMAKVVA